MSTPTIFLSAASIDLKEWRDVLHGAFSRAGFHVYTENNSFGAATGDVRHLLTQHILDSDCVIHLAGVGYGSHAQDPFPEDPGFVCSWTQFEYYFAHQQRKNVIAFVCAPELSQNGFVEKGDAAECLRKSELQKAHRLRVESGQFTGTPFEERVKRASHEPVGSVQALLAAVAAAVGTLHRQGRLAPSARRLAAITAAQAELTARLALHRLPPPPPGFVGRTEELARLRALDPSAGALLTGLKGMGGIGKTALALVLAHEWLGRFPDAQFFLDARGTQEDPPSAATLLAQILQAFHPAQQLPAGETALRTLYHQTLEGKRVLLLLDNTYGTVQATPLIPPSGSALIVTSRHSFVLGNVGAYTVGRLPHQEATALLREFYPALSDLHANQLVKLCAGLPLALRLAGAHLALDAANRPDGVPNVAGYLHLLRSGPLDTLDKDAPDAGETTISETLRVSEAQLSPTDREAWRRLSVFTASFEVQGAAAVMGLRREGIDVDAAPSLATLDTATTGDLLTRFVRRSLLEHEGADRYRLHDLATEYARAQFSHDELSIVYLAHARHYAAVSWEADRLNQEKGHYSEGLALFDHERAQIEAAFAWLSGQNADAPARTLLSLVNSVVHTADLRFHPTIRIEWHKTEIHAAQSLQDHASEARALNRLGNAFVALGEIILGIDHYDKSLTINRAIGDRRGECEVLRDLGIARADLGHIPEAVAHYEQSLEIAQSMMDQRNESIVLGSLGNAYALQRQSRKAVECYDLQLAIARQIGDRRGEGNAKGNLGNAHRWVGDIRKAIACHEHHLAIAREIGHRRGQGVALGNLGSAYLALGELPRALEHLKQSIAISQEIGDRRGEANALFNSAIACHRLRNHAQAVQLVNTAWKLYEITGAPAARSVKYWEIQFRQAHAVEFWQEALRLHALGQRTEAILSAKAALEIFDDIENPLAPVVRTTLAEWKGEASPL